MILLPLLLLLSVFPQPVRSIAPGETPIVYRRDRPAPPPRNLRVDDKFGGTSIDLSDVLDPDYADSVTDSDTGDPLASFLGMVSSAAVLAKDYLLAATVDESGVEELNLNAIVRDLTDEGGWLLLEIRDGYLLDLGTGSRVNLTHVGVKGLDTFRVGKADLLRTGDDDGGGAATILENVFFLETLVLDLFMKEYATPSGGTGAEEMSEVSIRLPFEGVDVASMPLLLDLSAEGLASFPLGSALNATHALPCLYERVVKDVGFSRVEASFEGVGTPELLSTTSPTGRSPFHDVAVTLFVGLPASVPIFFNSTVRALLNDYLTSNLLEPPDERDAVFEHYCHPTLGEEDPAAVDEEEKNNDDDDDDDDLVDFRTFFDAGLPSFLVGFFEDEFLAVDPSTGLPKINEDLLLPMMESLAEGNGGDGDGGDDDDAIGVSSVTRDPLTGTTDMVVGRASGDGLVNVTTELAIGGLVADIGLVVTDLTLSNLDTMVRPLVVLEPLPEEPHRLYNAATMGLPRNDPRTDPDGTRSMGLSANVGLSIITAGSGSIEHDLRLSMTVESLRLAVTALLEVARPKLDGFPIRDVLELQCWLATLRIPALDPRTGVRLGSEPMTAGIADAAASLDAVTLAVECRNGDGDADADGGESGGCNPGTSEWVDLLATSSAQEGATESMNSVLGYVASDILSDGGAILQTPLDRWLADAPKRCPHSPSYDPAASSAAANGGGAKYEPPDALSEYEYSYEYLIVWGSLASASLIVLCGLAVGVRCNVRRKHRAWIADDDDDDDDDALTREQKRHLAGEHRKQAEADDLAASLDDSTESLFRSVDAIPSVVRWGMPVVVVGNIALFLSGHLNLGATVYIEANLAGEAIRVGDFFDFAIARTTIDLWKAGGKALAMLIVVFSIVWPYTKQFLTLALWFLPPATVSVGKRGKFLIWLDKLAKWSMIDIFVIVVCIAAFRVEVSSPDVAFLPEGFYAVDLMVVPMWGLYSNMTAQLVSQVSSHFIIWYHRNVVAAATKNLEEKRNTKEKKKPSAGAGEAGDGGDDPEATVVRLHTHAFSNPHRSFESATDFVAKTWVGPTLLAATGSIAILMALGSFVPSFSVEVLGVIGVAVESGQNFDEAITHHSVWSIVSMLFDEARFLGSIGDYTGIAVLSALFFATILVVPVVQAIGLVYQWYAPLARTRRRKLMVVNEILQAWQYVEVYLMALFVASWQLGPVSQYMFNAYCGSLDGFFAKAVSYGILTKADAQCFSVQGGIDPGLIALLVAAVLLAVVNSVVTLAGKQCLEASSNDSSSSSSSSNNNNNTAGNGSQTSGSSDTEEFDDSAKTIRRFSFLFTDGCRWLLAPTAVEKGTGA